MGEIRETDELGPTVQETVVRNRSAVFILGIIEILLGVGIIALETAALIWFNQPNTPGYPVQYGGIWTGVFAILAGIIQLLAGKKTISPGLRGRLFTVGLGTAIVSILQTGALFCLTAYNIYLVRRQIKQIKNDDILDATAPPHLPLTHLEDLAMLRNVVSLVYITLCILTLATTILDCCNTCGKKHGHSPPSDQVVYTSVDGNQVKQIKIYSKSQQVKA